MLAAITCVVRNEVDIIEAWCRYHVEIAEKLFVCDHRSVDGTLEILRELETEGLPITVEILTAPTLTQGPTTSELLRRIATSERPRFLIPLDADEFVSPAGEARHHLEALSDSQPTTASHANYIPSVYDDVGERNPIVRIQHRRLTGKAKRKVIVPQNVAADHTYGVANGNHRVIYRGRRETLPAALTADLHIAHFPIRSVEQVMWRLISWYSSGAKVSKTKKRILQDIRSGVERDTNWLFKIATDYSINDPGDAPSEITHDPLRPTTALRLPNDAKVSLLGAYLDAVENILEMNDGQDDHEANLLGSVRSAV